MIIKQSEWMYLGGGDGGGYIFFKFKINSRILFHIFRAHFNDDTNEIKKTKTTKNEDKSF